MTSTGDFQRRVSRSIQASIAVKELLLQSSEAVSVVAKVGELLVHAFQKVTRCFCSAMEEARGTHSTLQQNSSVGLRLIVRPCQPWRSMSTHLVSLLSGMTTASTRYSHDRFESLGSQW